MNNNENSAMRIELTRTNFDPTDPLYHPFLDDLQGNILKSHGRNYSVHLFFRITNAGDARKWIADFAGSKLTSAIKQFSESRLYKKYPDKYPYQTFAGLLLTSSGYEALGIPSENIPSDIRFRIGMKHPDVKAWLHDPPVDEWQAEFQAEIHALIILSSDLDPKKQNQFSSEVENISQEIGAFGELVHTEYGHVMREHGDHGYPVEHFGYVDGLSQPLFYEKDIQRAKKESGRGLWDQSAPLNLVVTSDPNGKYADSCGSYFVYRKLYQDVHKFQRLSEELAETLESDYDFAGASIVGRFKDGTPLVKYKRPQRTGENASDTVPNNFTYDNDPDGRKCPFHAHIRKANPRGEKHDEPFTRLLRFLGQFRWLRNRFDSLDKRIKEMDKMERDRRIARRGISYGPVNPEPGDDAGLLFLGAQSNIASQFEFIQNTWSNKNTFLEDGTGLDPVIGQGFQQDGGQYWSIDWKDSRKRQFDFRDCVRLRGGEYFFAPSLSFLKSL
ncbi:MAG: peroxidase [Candidatus Marinimicrobia bacterium]|nr:peroxidase [Candidatus Neomarinimicrobiota bacterium]